MEICRINAQTDELVTIDEEDAQMDDLFPVAEALLAEDDLFLYRSATTLTLQGDLELDSDISEDDEADDKGFPDDEELASFEHKGAEYCIIKVGMPLMLVGKATLGGNDEQMAEFALLDDETNERVSTAIQAELDLQFDIQIEGE